MKQGQAYYRWYEACYKAHFDLIEIRYQKTILRELYLIMIELGNTQPRPDRRVLAAVDGSLNSLRVLNHAVQTYNHTSGMKILVLNVIEWPNDAEDYIDDELAMKIEDHIGGTRIREHSFRFRFH